MPPGAVVLPPAPVLSIRRLLRRRRCLRHDYPSSVGLQHGIHRKLCAVDFDGCAAHGGFQLIRSGHELDAPSRRQVHGSAGRFLRYAPGMVERVLATDEALRLIERLKTKHGPLMFHQSGGCCDGSAPMCYPQGEFRVGGNDVRLGAIGGCDVYMDADQFDYWKHTQLIIDVVPGRGSGFSLEAPEGVRFLTRSRVFTDEEVDALEAVPAGGAAA